MVQLGHQQRSQLSPNLDHLSSHPASLAWLLSPQVAVISLVITVKGQEIILPPPPLHVVAPMSVPFSARRDVSKRKWDIQIHSTHVPPPCGQSGSWKAIYLLVQFPKSCCVESLPLICGSGASSGVHKQSYSVISPRSSLSKVFRYFPVPKILLLGQKAEKALFTLCWREFPLTAPKSEAKPKEDGGEEKTNKGSPCHLQQVVSLEKKEWKSLSPVWLFVTPWTL